MRLGLVLSGGGATGAFEVGVVAAMEEAGLRAEVLSGTSAGALNAAGLACGLDAAALGRLWTSERGTDVFRLRADLWNLVNLPGLLGHGTDSLVQRVLRGIGWPWLL